MKKISLIVLVMIGLLSMGCPGPFHPDGPKSFALIYYKNRKGEDLFNPAVAGHYNRNEVRLNGLVLGEGEFSIDTIHGTSFPAGYAVSFRIWDYSYKTDSIVNVIQLNANTRDTLSSKIEKSILASCKYNRVDVFNKNLLSGNTLQVVIVK